MAKETVEQLKARGTTIKEEVQKGGNTKERIGEFVENAADSFRHKDDTEGFQLTAEKNKNSGYAGLDENARLEEAQLPNKDVFNNPTNHPVNNTPDQTRNIHISNENNGTREIVSIQKLFEKLGFTVSEGQLTSITDILSFIATSGFNLLVDGVNVLSIRGAAITVNNELIAKIIKQHDGSGYNEIETEDGVAWNFKSRVLPIIIQSGVNDANKRDIIFKTGNTELARFGSNTTLGTGAVYTNSGVFTNTNPSDERMKTVHGKYQRGLTDVLKFAKETIEYNYLTDREKDPIRSGYLANKIQKFAPELVGAFKCEQPIGKKDKDGNDIIKEVERLGFVDIVPNPMLANAIKEIHERQNSLEERIRKLELK